MKKVRSTLILGVLLTVAGPARGQLWDKNLIVNGDAEQGTGVTTLTAAPVTNIPGWTTSGSFTLCQWVNGMPTDKRYIKEPGKQFFAGGPKGGAATAKQTIDLSSGATEIDAGRVKFYLNAWMSNGGSQVLAPAKIAVTFLDGGGKTLLEYTINAPTQAEVDNNGLFPRSGSGFVLPNTRSVQLVVDLTSKTLTGFNGASAENIVFKLALEPVLTSNLVVNGDGEGQTPDTRPPGWNSGNLDVYKANSLKFVEPPLATLGVYMLSGWGGPGPRTASAYQTIDVTLAKDRIDGNGAKYKLSALMGGHQDFPDDWSTIKLECLDASGKAIGSAVQLGPVTAADRGNKTTFVERSAEGTLPSGARVLRITLNFSVKAGNFGMHTYLDNISLVLTSGGTVAIKDGGIVNAATGDPGPVAPGEMILVYTTGVNLTASARTQLDPAGKVATTIGDVRLFFDGTQSPLLSVSQGQVGAVVPFDVDGKANVQVRLEYQGTPSQTVPMGVVSTSPGIFTQDGSPAGVGLIYNADYSLNSQENPAPEGSRVSVFWTGGGQTDPGGVDGRIELMPLSRPKASVAVTIGGKAADLVFAGGTPYGWTGLLMAEVKVPSEIAGDDPVAAPVVVTAGSASSPDKKVVMWVRK